MTRLFFFDPTEEERVCETDPIHGCNLWFCKACGVLPTFVQNLWAERPYLVSIDSLITLWKENPRSELDLHWHQDRPVPNHRSGGLGGKKRGCTPGQSRVGLPGIAVPDRQKSWRKHMIKTPARGP